MAFIYTIHIIMVRIKSIRGSLIKRTIAWGLFSALLLVVMSCKTTGSSKCEKDPRFLGKWDAKWITDPSFFPEIENIDSFEMDGSFDITCDSILVVAYGYQGCIFGADTISHTQGWDIGKDSLHLMNLNNARGISYIFEFQQDGGLVLKLMGDIFVNLKKVD